MPFPRRLLIPDEQLVLDLRPHPIALVMPAVVTIVAFVAAIWLEAKTTVDWLWWALFLLVVVLYPVPKLVAWLSSSFAVPSDWLIDRRGFIGNASAGLRVEAVSAGVFDGGLGGG